jgi:hypothetical protein
MDSNVGYPGHIMGSGTGQWNRLHLVSQMIYCDQEVVSCPAWAFRCNQPELFEMVLILGSLLLGAVSLKLAY